MKQIEFCIKSGLHTRTVYVTLKNHKAKFDIEPGGYLVNYRNSDNERGLSKYMLPKAIELGATWLKCYGHRVKLYQAFGFTISKIDHHMEIYTMVLDTKPGL